MGILTIGLLGVASVFPVGSFYMQKAEIADRGSAIAQSVMSDIISRGMLNPRSWYVMVPNPRNPNPASAAWNTGFSSDGKFAPGGTVKSGQFTRPFALALNEALNQTVASTDRTLLGKQFGSAYAIDPLGVSMMEFDSRQNNAPTQVPPFGPAALFPATAYNNFFSYGKYPGWNASAWAPWTGGSQGSYDGFQWPIRRVTFRQSSTGWHMDPQMAEHYFRGSDDLAYDFPARDDRPAIPTWDTTVVSGNTAPLARKWTGDYSWIVTVAPTTNAARDGMARNPEGYAYDVSVVVFYKRVLPGSADIVYPETGQSNTQFLSAMGANERSVKAGIVSTGLNGGELLLTDWGDVVDPSNKPISAFDHLRSGQWIMLCGPHPNSSTSEPRFALNWYQVLSIEPANSSVYGYDSTLPAERQRVVAVRGPQWPWQPSYTAADASNDLCVAICKGAVAVHAKTMRLEGRGSAWNVAAGGAAASGAGTAGGSAGDGSFGSAGNPTSSQPNFGFY